MPDLIDTDRVRGYVCEAVEGCTLDHIVAVTRFESGERHAVFKVSYIDAAGLANDVVVRVVTSEDANDCDRATREAKVLAKVQDVAGPTLYDFRCDSPWFDSPVTCLRFVPGEQRDLGDVGPEDIEHLGALVGWLHELAVDDLVEWFSPSPSLAAYVDDRVENVALKLPSVRDSLPASLQDRLARAWASATERLIALGSADDGLVLTHGDIGPGNILWDPQPVLIDWEYARLGDPADEIAYTFGEHNLNAGQRAAFWRGYRQSTDDQQRLDRIVDRVDLWEPFTRIGSVLWWVERWARRADADASGQPDPATPKPQTYYIDQAIQRLNRWEDRPLSSR